MPRHLACLVVASLGLFASGAVSGQLANPAGRLLVGVHRLDGVIIPFAELRDGAWSNEAISLWSPSEGMTAGGPPWFENDGPVPGTWLAVDSSGSIRTIRPGRPQVVDTHCELTWGLPAPSLTADVDPFVWPRNAGIAVAGATRVAGFVRLATDSPEAVGLLDMLRGRFVDAEAVALAAPLDRPRASADSRTAHAVTIESCLRSRQPVLGRWVYRARLTRQYPPHPATPDQTCPDATTFESWVFTEGSRPPTLLAGADIPDAPTLTLDDCDLKTTPRIIPLGVFDARGRTYVVAVEHGYESEGYVLLEASSTGPVRQVVTARAGGC